MKKTFFWICVIAAALIVFNVFTRSGAPDIHSETLIPWLANHSLLSGLTDHLLLPGGYGLWYLGLPVTTKIELIIAAVLSWWTYLICARMLRFILFLKH